uniref:Uncharacterized protein n=1 Tax=Virus NIOZ-UU157 TaxID=2763269 RepID=A0A7S9SU37_9VIRU|nr:MAG: hypothetical protein NIOZUU157_00258 [Virus NIOZ-UU157]
MNIVIKLTASGPNLGPFDILSETRKVLRSGVSRIELSDGITVTVTAKEDNFIILKSNGNCAIEKVIQIEDISTSDYNNLNYSQIVTGCLWTHLKNPQIYNYYYGKIEPYIIEYPFSYSYNDELLQNVKDYSKVYKYLPSDVGSFDTNSKIQIDNKWFNKAVLYNGQQSTGLLKLVPKPENNLSAYMQYPILNTDSKTITFSKSDNFYQYNTFWALQVDDQLPLFNSSCESLSIDKVINQSNMDYGNRSFKKATLRAKNLKVRHILDDSSTTHIVSQFIVTPSQISYK